MKAMVLKFLRRGKVQKLLAIMGYYLGINLLFYWLNRRSKRILTFHNVLPDNLFRNDGTNGVSCSESDFRRIIQEVGHRFNYSADVFDAKTVTITFDDGYLNQYEIAADILQKMGDIPAILFVSGDVVNSRSPDEALEVDRLLFWKSYVPISILKEWSGMDGDRNLIWGQKLWPMYVDEVKHRSEFDASHNGLLAQLNLIYPFERIWENLPERLMKLRMTGVTEKHILELRSRNWIVGWHTKSHRPLSALANSEALNELLPPTDMRSVVFSFPYGETKSVSLRDIETVKKLGYPCAVSNVNVPNNLQGLYFMHRITLPPEVILLNFELSGFGYFSRYGKLLPRICR